MKLRVEPWQAKVEEKVVATSSETPQDWLLDQSDLKRASQCKQLSGPFIESFLQHEELEIIRKDSVPLVESIKDG